MRLFVSPFAPNALRVQIIAQEKAIPLEIVNITADRQGYLAINPLGQVPALERDDGSILAESLTIAQYLDRVSGAPFLFGDDAEERLSVAMWERRAEMQLFNPGIEYGHHVHPMFGAFMTQFPEFAASLRPKAKRAAAVFAGRLDRTHYLAGERFTAADVTACLGYLFLRGYGAFEGETWPELERWSDQILARDSMAPVRQLIAWFEATAPGAS